MAVKYNNIKELRQKKALLKKEIDDLQDLITFKDTKQSLSVMTKGASDQYLTKEMTPEGEKLTVQTKPLMQHIGDTVTGKAQTNSIIKFDNTGTKEVTKQNLLKLGALAIAGFAAKKIIKSRGFKNRIMGIILVYFGPKIAKVLLDKLEEYQKNKSVNSVEKLI